MSRLFDAALPDEDEGLPRRLMGRQHAGLLRRLMGREDAAYGASARKKRALQQPILFVDYRASDTSIAFEVLGATGSNYRVQFVSSAAGGWSCTCPDYAPHGRAPRRGHKCKHIFFVLARILHVPIDDDREAPPAFKTIDQVEAAMVRQRVGRQFTYDPTQPLPPSPPPRPPARVPTAGRRRHHRRHAPEEEGDEAAPPSSPDASLAAPVEAKSISVPQRPYLGDECCICYDKFTPDCAVFFCESTCGKTVHQTCFQRLVDFKQAPLCPYCRADMRPAGLSLPTARKRRRRS